MLNDTSSHLGLGGPNFIGFKAIATMTDQQKPVESQQPMCIASPLNGSENISHLTTDTVHESSPAKLIPLSSFPKLITSDELFGAERQIFIDHGGSVYRLQITKQGKLILTK